MSTAVTPPGNQNDKSRPEADRAANHAATSSADHRRSDPKAVLQRQKDRFGGMKFGACFFGWLTATGTLVLLTALLSAVGAGLGADQGVSNGQVMENAQTIGIVGAIVLLVVVLLSYFCGGYVAGRMARFNGFKQGLGVWLWAIIITVVLTILAIVAGSQFGNLSTQVGIPRIPVDRDSLTTGGIVTAIALVIAALLGAVLGGLAGMRFHRRVDRADLGFDDADRVGR